MELKEPSQFNIRRDYFNYLLAREKSRLKQFRYRGTSKNSLNSRRFLVESIHQWADKLKLEVATYHLAVHILDLYLDKVSVDPGQLMITTSMCLMIACKTIGSDYRVPSMSQMRKMLCDLDTPLKVYNQTEGSILIQLDFEISYVSPIHFIELWMSTEPAYAPFDSDFQGLPHLHQQFKERAMAVAGQALLNPCFIRVPPSVMAAASMAVTRRNFMMDLTWPSQMCTLTGYIYNDIAKAVNDLFLCGSDDEENVIVVPPPVRRRPPAPVHRMPPSFLNSCGHTLTKKRRVYHDLNLHGQNPTQPLVIIE